MGEQRRKTLMQNARSRIEWYRTNAGKEFDAQAWQKMILSNPICMSTYDPEDSLRRNRVQVRIENEEIRSLLEEERKAWMGEVEADDIRARIPLGLP